MIVQDYYSMTQVVYFESMNPSRLLKYLEALYT